MTSLRFDDGGCAAMTVPVISSLTPRQRQSHFVIE
jgi:hypothetical protein